MSKDGAGNKLGDLNIITKSFGAVSKRLKIFIFKILKILQCVFNERKTIAQGHYL